MSKLKSCWFKAVDVMSAPFRMLSALLLSTAIIPMVMTPTFCPSRIDTNLDLDALGGGVIDLICKIALYVGVIMAAGGVFSLVLAYKDDNADGQSRAIRIVVVGAALIGLKMLLQVVGIIK